VGPARIWRTIKRHGDRESLSSLMRSAAADPVHPEHFGITFPPLYLLYDWLALRAAIRPSKR
jgi:hypothetical protein